MVLLHSYLFFNSISVSFTVNTVSTVATVSTQAKVHGAPRRFKENSRIMRAHVSMIQVKKETHTFCVIVVSKRVFPVYTYAADNRTVVS